MKTKLTLIFLLAALTMSAQYPQRPIEIPLWPDGAPTDNVIPADQKERFDKMAQNLAATDNPTLTIHKAADPNGTAILMCPGGAYIGWAGTHEGNDMASWMTSQGITFAVLHYRMPNGHKEVPLSDAEQAMRILKGMAGELGVDSDNIGVMGASAGGHLAASLATLYSSSETRPAFQILFYPVITMKEGLFDLKIRTFLDACKNGTPAPVPSSQILYNQAIIDGIAKSAEAGREVEIVIPEI